MKKSPKTLFKLATTALAFLLVVQVSAIGLNPPAKEVLLQPKTIAVEAALAVDAPVAMTNEVFIIAEPVTAIQAPAVPVSGSDAVATNAAKTEVPEPQVTATETENKPQFIFPGVMYDKENQQLVGHNERGLIWLGFDYDINQNVFYTALRPWQKTFGYTSAFDKLAPLAGIFIKTREVCFNYDGREWMIRLWKGQYGITSGAEIGVYTKSTHIANHYYGVDEEDFLFMNLDVYKNGAHYFTLEPQKHWWLSGYIVGGYTQFNEIDIDSTITFKDQVMTDAFIAALSTNEGTNDVTYTVNGVNVSLHW